MCVTSNSSGGNLRTTTVTFPPSTLSRIPFEKEKQFIRADCLLRIFLQLNKIYDSPFNPAILMFIDLHPTHKYTKRNSKSHFHFVVVEIVVNIKSR